jgi:hypothetical protein
MEIVFVKKIGNFSSLTFLANSFQLKSYFGTSGSVGPQKNFLHNFNFFPMENALNVNPNSRRLFLQNKILEKHQKYV